MPTDVGPTRPSHGDGAERDGKGIIRVGLSADIDEHDAERGEGPKPDVPRWMPIPAAPIMPLAPRWGRSDRPPTVAVAAAVDGRTVKG